MGFFDRFRKPPTQLQFSVLMIDRLRSLGDSRPWVYAESMKCLVLSGAGNDAPSAVINLANMYQDYVAARTEQRDEVLRRQASGMMQHYLPADFGDARLRLRPVIRSATERGVTYLQVGTDKEKRNVAFRPLCENMEIGIAYDGEFNILRLTDAQLAAWNVTFDEAFEAAIDNLRHQSSKPFMALKDGVFASQFGDYYDASRLLLTDLLHRQAISGAPVVMVPNRTVLLLTGDRNDTGLELMLQIAIAERAKPRPLPPLMMRWGGQSWERFVPPGLEARLRELRIQELAADYQDQSQLLNESHDRIGLDIAAGQYMVVKRPTGELFSSCTWTDGSTHSLLPEVDIVVLHRASGQPPAFVPWAELLRACGHLMKPTEHLPVRYEVRDFPSDDVFQQLSSRFGKV